MAAALSWEPCLVAHERYVAALAGEDPAVEIGEKFLQARDPDNPEQAICEEYYMVNEIHSGPYIDLESDIILGIKGTFFSYNRWAIRCTMIA